MKKKRIRIGAICVIAILLLGAVVLVKNNISISTGTCIAADNGEYLVVLGQSPVVMHQHTGKKTVFSGLNTGDKILILHDGIDTSYPGQTGLYFLLKLSDGEESDVPEKIMDELQELGWLHQTDAEP